MNFKKIGLLSLLCVPAFAQGIGRNKLLSQE